MCSQGTSLEDEGTSGRVTSEWHKGQVESVRGVAGVVRTLQTDAATRLRYSLSLATVKPSLAGLMLICLDNHVSPWLDSTDTRDIP
jgi:hypothetical protein